MGSKIETPSSLTSLLAIPFESLSGKATFHLHQMTYGTNSPLKKQILFPFATLCAIPIAASADICLRTIQWVAQPSSPRDQFSHYLRDLTSHVVSVVALPLRLIYYYCSQNQDALFSIRHSSDAAPQMLISLMRTSADPKFVQDVLQKMPLSENELQENLSVHDRILYRLRANHDQFLEALGYEDLSKHSSNFNKTAFDIAVVMSDQALLDDVCLASSHFELLPACVEQGGNHEHDEQTRQKYCKQALILYDGAASQFSDRSSISADDPLHWLDVAVSTGQSVLLQRILEGSSQRVKRIICRAFMRSLEKIAEKALAGEENYQQLLSEIFHCDYGDGINVFTPFTKARCDAFFAQWLDREECLSSLNLLQQLLGKCYRANEKVPAWYLRLAIQHRSPQLLALFNPFRIDVNALDFNQLSLLEQALLSSKNQIELVELLCQKGADVDARFIGNPPLILDNTSLKGHTPLTYAVSNGNHKLVKVLILYTKEKNPISQHPSYAGKTVRKIALKKGHIDLLELLGLLTPEEQLGWSQLRQKFASLYGKAAPFVPAAKAHRPPPTPFTEPHTNAETRVLELFKNPNLLTKKTELTNTLNNLREVHTHKNLWLAFDPETTLSEQALKAAYRKLLIHIHPDKNPAERIMAEKIFQVISAIKDELLEFLEAQ